METKGRQTYPMALPKGAVLCGKYEIKDVIGEGGFGITYIAVDKQTNAIVAIKEYFPQALATREGKLSIMSYSGERQADFEYGKEGFLEEAKTLAEFIGNPGIVRVHSYFEENGTAYFVMDYLEGQNLKQYIDSKGGKLEWEAAWNLLVPVADALFAVHAKGIIHRDVKPENIFIKKDGSVKLIDFGAARYSLGNRSQSLDVVLTHGFAPMEQYTRHGRQGPYTDLYAFAATYYYAITGKTLPDSVERIEEDLLIPPGNLGIHLTRTCEDALLTALEVRSADRYQSMEEFKDAFVRGINAPTPYNSASDSEDMTGDRVPSAGKEIHFSEKSDVEAKPEEKRNVGDASQPQNIEHVETEQNKDNSVEQQKAKNARAQKEKDLSRQKRLNKLVPKIVIGCILGVCLLYLIGRSSTADRADSSQPVAGMTSSETEPETKPKAELDTEVNEENQQDSNEDSDTINDTGEAQNEDADKQAEKEVGIQEETDQAPQTSTPDNPVHHCTWKDGGSDYTDWSYVYFGSYPQSEVTDAETISAIDSVITSSGVNGDAGVDVWVGETKYRRIGKSDTNNDEYFGDSTYRYFKWERIKWKVLSNDGSTLFVVADKGLDCKKYHGKSSNVTWETCTLRSWLGNQFYNAAFSAAEQSAIVTQSVV
ncbi:MAG: protein kinase, partial [Lachnospiraceae bacterium]|nr:protein kinase [Lachnospiraceae bacterium]